MSTFIRSLRQDDSAAFKDLYDCYFSGFTLYYGGKLEKDFLAQRVFSSSLYSTDCSIVKIGEESQIKAVLIANLRQYPGQDSSNCIYFNQLIFTQDSVGMESGKCLIAKLLKISEKTRIITSLQWAGMWPGVLAEDWRLRKILQDTGWQLIDGDLFAHTNINDLIMTCKSRCIRLPSGFIIRHYLDTDSAGLIKLISQHFSAGWMHEVLTKVGLTSENFNGYGLIDTFQPKDVFVVVQENVICGFCVVQSITRDNRSFFGPIGLIPEVRGRGVGLCLLLKAVEYLSKHGKTSLGLWTSESIYYRFYQNLGMQKAMQTHQFEKSTRGGDGF